MLLENIDRIEIIRGPGGSVWGSNAVNGVINIIPFTQTLLEDGHTVLILTSSQAPSDIEKSYDNYANGYIIKPMGLEKMRETTSLIEQFWFNLAELP